MAGVRQANTKLAARTTMQAFGYDPIEELIRIAQATGTNNDTKIAIAQGLTPYMYPKLGAIEVQNVGDESVGVDARRELATRILSDPKLADAAHSISLAAADVLLERETAEEREALASPLLA